MARKGRGWHGERERHRQAALKGKHDVEDSRLLLRTLTTRLEGKPEGGVWWKVGPSFMSKRQAVKEVERIRLLGYRGEPMYAKLKEESDGWWAVYRKARTRSV